MQFEYNKNTIQDEKGTAQEMDQKRTANKMWQDPPEWDQDKASLNQTNTKE